MLIPTFNPGINKNIKEMHYILKISIVSDWKTQQEGRVKNETNSFYN